VARRTTLYQRARSPLIQGYSKHEKPVWHAVLGGLVLAAVVWTSWFYVYWRASANAPDWLVIGLAYGAVYLAGALAGSWLGAVIGRSWGVRARWIGAAVFAVAVGGIAMAIAVRVVPAGVMV